MDEAHEGEPWSDDGHEIHEQHWCETEWAAAAQGYLGRLKKYLRKQERVGHSISIPVAGKPFLVSPAEQQLICDLGDADAEPLSEADDLIRHSIGLQVKVLDDVRQYQRVGQDERAAALRRLDTGISYGDSCAYEMHRLMSELSRDGNLEGSKEMADYRRRLVKVLENAGQLAGVADKKKNELELKTNPEYDPDAARLARARALQKQKKKSKKDLSAARKKIYTVMTCVLFGILLVALIRLWVGLERDLPLIKTSDLASVPGVENVVCRPPDVLVIMTDASWNALSKGEKQKAIQKLADIALSMGYRRAEFRSYTREDLALWRKGQAPTVN